jgi:hypothetical protein
MTIARRKRSLTLSAAMSALSQPTTTASDMIAPFSPIDHTGRGAMFR